MEPKVSVPIEKPTSPAAVAAPGPADEPLAAFLGIPGILGGAAMPDIAISQRAQGQLGDQDSAGPLPGAARRWHRDRSADPCRAWRPQPVG